MVDVCFAMVLLADMLENTGGISSYDNIVGNVFGDNRACPDHHIVANGNSW